MTNQPQPARERGKHDDDADRLAARAVSIRALAAKVTTRGQADKLNDIADDLEAMAKGLRGKV